MTEATVRTTEGLRQVPVTASGFWRLSPKQSVPDQRVQCEVAEKPGEPVRLRQARKQTAIA